MDDAFQKNITGVANLVEAGINKTFIDGQHEEGQTGEKTDLLELPMTDEELLELKKDWERQQQDYSGKIKPRQEKNKTYYVGRQRNTAGEDKVVSSNLIFEAEETFIPQALSKNPEPVVWSDNSEEGKAAADEIKSMLQYHADILCLRKKLGVMVRHWSIYFLGVVKHGWDEKVKEIKTEIRKPQNFVLDPEGYIDEYGNFCGNFLGERIETTAERLVEMFPSGSSYVKAQVDNKMGTRVTRTEWWTDEYCFTTYKDIILEKHKNELFNYEEGAVNHFAVPKMPYTFLSVFSLQEIPHDITNLVEQSIPNQDRINDRDDQISRNLRAGNNSIALSGLSFNTETAHQAAMALEDGDPVLVPGGKANEAIVRFPASNIPSSVFTAQENDKLALRQIFGTQGISAQPQNEDTTARGMILNQSHDASRIGGGIGDALEQVADNIFNWWVQLYAVFYDEPHYGAIMGNGRAVEYVQIQSSNLQRKFVVSVSPNSMQPKDEITEQNLAIDLANKGWLDPINLFKKLNYPNPMETAKMVTLFRVNPQMYMQQFFPEQGAVQGQNLPNNPPDLNQQLAQPEAAMSLAQPPASSALSQVPLTTAATPQ